MVLAELQTIADRALVERMVQRDEQAVQALVDRHGDALFALACSILHEREDAEEVTADAFLQAWRTAASFDPARASVIAWLAMITRSRALDRLRVRRRAGGASARGGEITAYGEGETVTHAEDVPDRNFEQLETKQLVERALSDLPAAQRDVIELAYRGGLSQSEISERLGVPLGTVKTRTLAAMKRLRELLAPLLGEGVA
jgi:RNA polymerase sigma-70 factor (ECF subfamily)